MGRMELPLDHMCGPRFPGGTSGKEPTCQCKRHKETWVWSLSWEDPLEDIMAPTPVFMPKKSNGQRSLAGYSPLVLKESDTTEAT